MKYFRGESFFFRKMLLARALKSSAFVDLRKVCMRAGDERPSVEHSRVARARRAVYGWMEDWVFEPEVEYAEEERTRTRKRTRR